MTATRQISREVPDLQHLNFVCAEAVGDEIVLVDDEFACVLVGTSPAEQWEFTQAVDLARNRQRELAGDGGLVGGDSGRDLVQIC